MTNAIIIVMSFLLYTGRGMQSSTTQKEGPAPQSSQLTRSHQPSFVFREVAPVIRRESSVPPRLPEFLPQVDENHPIYAIAQSVSKTNYDILLAVVVPCEGQNNCLYGSVQGSSAPFERLDGKVTTLKLRAGITGEFIEAVCHVYCSQAYVRWEEDGFYYSIGIKAGKMNTLANVANSALASGRAGR